MDSEMKVIRWMCGQRGYARLCQLMRNREERCSPRHMGGRHVVRRLDSNMSTAWKQMKLG